MAEADVAELQQLFDSVEAKQYKRPDMNEDLRLEEFDGRRPVERRHGDGYSRLLTPCKGFQARLDEVEAWQAQRGPKNELKKRSSFCLF